jgi:hypothetical protein
MDKIVVYHGTPDLFDEIDLSHSRNNRDFGCGFYTTTIKSQAESWATNLAKRRHSAQAYVYKFEFTPNADLKIKKFEEMTTEWLDFIKDNRTLGGCRHEYDCVFGPVANDRTIFTITRYIDGEISAEEAIRQLSYFRANNQLSFHTQLAVDSLNFVERESVE